MVVVNETISVFARLTDSWWRYHSLIPFRVRCIISHTGCKTSSSAVAERPRDASCLSVVSFSSTIPRAQRSLLLFVSLASDLPMRT